MIIPPPAPAFDPILILSVILIQIGARHLDLELTEFQKKLLKWEYVPCETCFKNNKVNKLKKNGTSHRGRIILALMDTFQDGE